MEARLGSALGVRAVPQTMQAASVTAEVPEVAVEAVETVEPAISGDDAGGAIWPDASAESAFLADARARGEPVVVAKAAEEVPEETDPKTLPPLNELVQRIPTEVREALEDLFRAKFVRVQRVPKKALKG